ncbi:WD repeat-containing protein mio, partial [Schistosoma bovis]
LAQGFDRPRNSREPSVLIWDVTKYTGSRHPNVKSTDRGSVCANDLHTHTYSLPFAINGSDYSAPDTQATSSLVSVYSSVSEKEWISNTTTCDKPLCDLGIQDTASFAWLSKSSFIAGMSGTYLKVFDLSDPSKVCQITTTRAVYGLTVDPLCSKRFASFCEVGFSIYYFNFLTTHYLNVACGWSANQTLVWSYTRDWTAFNLTGIVSSNLQTLMEFLHAVNENKRSENSVNNGNTTYSLSNAQYLANCQNIKNKDYHNDNINGNKYCHEKQTALLVHLKRCMELDIAVVMRKRAELGYGLDITGATYVEIVKDDVQLRTMWTWIKYINDYMDDPLIRRHLDVDSSQSNYTSNQRNGSDNIPSKRRVPFRGSGVISLLCDNLSSSGTKLTSEVLMHVEWQGIDVKLPFSRYRSPERSRVLRFCMWPLDDTDVVQRPVFESLCSEGQYERAAAMALINLKFDWALSFLNRASSDADIDLVALALAGYTDTRNELWRTTCANLIKHLQNPYLRVMFVFLSRQGGDFQSILNDDALCLIDRVACACLYLNDDDLLVFLRSTCNSMVQRGQLESILLTGLCSNDFINLIQNYVDTTGDVQSAAIVGLHACQLSLNDNYSMVNNEKRTDMNDNNNVNNSRHVQIVLNGVRSSTVDKKLSIPLGGGGGYAGRGYSSGAGTSDQQPMIIKLGGLKIANWVQCYRDLLDQWQMWFYRADFDITYKSRLLSDYLYPSTSRTQMSSSLLISKSVEADMPTTSTVSGTGSSTTTNSIVTTVSTNNTNSSSYSSKVRNFGFIAGANQVFVACGFCGWRLEPQSNKLNVFNISGAGSGGSNTSNTMNSSSIIDTPCSPTPTTTTSTNLQMHGGGGKLTICQHCRKPLPRCSICLMHLGTSIPLNEYMSVTNAIKSAESMFQQTGLKSTGKLSVDFINAMQINPTSSSIPLSENNAINKSNQKNLYSSPEKSSSIPNSIPIADWFVWCQACRHGGHASHLTDWFYGDSFDLGDNGYSKECPVSGCQCHCAALDVNQTLSRLNYSRSSINSRSPDSEESSSLVDNEPIG